MKKIILASASPRRSKLLKKHGIDFTVLVSDADETNLGNTPKAIAEQNAYLKAKAVYDSLENKENVIVIGADTVVALDNVIYGKPKDKADAINMLKTLSGREHSVITGVAIIKNEAGVCSLLKPSEETLVKFKSLTNAEIEEYVNTDEPYDKAGSYALQGEAKKFVEYVKGDSENVIGLPAGKIKKYLILVIKMSEIAKIDKNFDFKTKINRQDVVFYDAKKEPFTVYGLIEEEGVFKRMKTTDAEHISDGVLRLHKNTAGGRVRFVTNSPYVAIHAKMDYMFKSPNYALTGSAGFDLYEQKENGECVYKGAFIPPLDSEGGYEADVELWTEETREIIINFPHYSNVNELYIGIKEGCEISKSKGYKHEDPIVFYGSSITQGACSSRAGTTYTNIVSRNLNSNILNLGFSGSAMGETKMAEYIAKLKMTALVIDYDFNAPNEEHLKNTHKSFFDIIRKAQPNLKILILSKPRHKLGPTDLRRKEIIENTYLEAVKSGDKNVAFLSGEDLIPQEFNEIFTVDLCHPNDCGFATMAVAVTNKLKELGV